MSRWRETACPRADTGKLCARVAARCTAPTLHRRSARSLSAIVAMACKSSVMEMTGNSRNERTTTVKKRRDDFPVQALWIAPSRPTEIISMSESRSQTRLKRSSKLISAFSLDRVSVVVYGSELHFCLINLMRYSSCNTSMLKKKQ